MDGSTAENIALVIGIVVAVSLALSTALGPLVTYLTEAVKGTGKVPDGYGGIVALVIGVILGMTLGVLADAMSNEPYPLGVMLLLGALAGALMAAGGVQNHKAMASVNEMPAYSAGMQARTDVATLTDLDNALNSVDHRQDPEYVEAVGFIRALKRERENASRPPPAGDNVQSL